MSVESTCRNSSLLSDNITEASWSLTFKTCLAPAYVAIALRQGVSLRGKRCFSHTVWDNNWAFQHLLRNVTVKLLERLPQGWREAAPSSPGLEMAKVDPCAACNLEKLPRKAEVLGRDFLLWFYRYILWVILMFFLILLFKEMQSSMCDSFHH